MLNRYIKITPQMKTTEPIDIEISGFKLFSGPNQVDISSANVRINFIPVAGDAAIIKRDTIVPGEALVIPAAKVRGVAAIYIDLIDNKSFDAFQIGFGSTQAKSLTKLKVEYSNDGITYRRLADITMNVRLKYRNPWTFSGITAEATSGFPGFLQRSLHHQFVNYQNSISNRDWYPRHHNLFIGEDGRRLFSKRVTNDAFDGDNVYGTQLQTTISSHLRRGKYYFEVSSKTGMNLPNRGIGIYMAVNLETKDGGQTGGSWGDWLASPPAGAAWPSRSMCFSCSTKYSGYRDGNNYYQCNQDLIGGPVPPGFIDIPGGKSGFLAGFTIDTISGQVKVVNSPFTPNFQFNGPQLVSGFTSRPDGPDERLYFSLLVPGRQDADNVDLTFNFGQEPFVGTVPDGFTDRIGPRWELELDPNELNYGSPYEVGGPLDCNLVDIRKPFTDPIPPILDSKKDHIIDSELRYYIKGKVSDVDGKFPRRNVELFLFPQMQFVASCGSSTVDGTYEFLHLWNRDYVVVSTDSLNDKFESVILGPTKPVLMDTTL